MNLDNVIAHIRKYAPLFENRVAGAAEEAAARETAFFPTPAAYVIPRADTVTENTLKIGLYQMIDEQIDVVIALDNRADRRGQGAVTSVDSVKRALFRALLNWQTETGQYVRGLQYVGGNLDGMNNALLWWRFTFSRPIQITHEDGFQPWGDEIEDFEITPADENGKVLP